MRTKSSFLPNVFSLLASAKSDASLQINKVWVEDKLIEKDDNLTSQRKKKTWAGWCAEDNGQPDDPVTDKTSFLKISIYKQRIAVVLMIEVHRLSGMQSKFFGCESHYFS